jgi:hypothetical protein
MSAVKPAQDAASAHIKGGSFLIETVSPSEVFTPEDFNEEQRMIAQTTADFVNNEVLPKMHQLENQYKSGDFSLTVELLHKAAELGLLAADIPAKYDGLELDKVCQMLMSEYVSRTPASEPGRSRSSARRNRRRSTCRTSAPGRCSPPTPFPSRAAVRTPSARAPRPF